MKHELAGSSRPLTVIVLAAVFALCFTSCGARRFDGEAALGLIEKQCSFGPRYPGSQGHKTMLTWLVGSLRSRTDAVSVQRFAVQAPTGPVELTNVIASFRPEERERVLLCAHWDTRAVAERDPDPNLRETPILGANDGASGVAVLLELARTMSERPPRRGVDLVFFDGEDGGDEGGLGEWCLGSSYYAAHLGGYAPEYAVVVDMIGDSDLGIPREANSAAAAPSVVDRVWRAARAVGADSFLDRTGPAMYDDHVPLIRAGIPAIVIIDPHYRYWHTVEDTPDKCSASSLSEVGAVLLELVYGRS